MIALAASSWGALQCQTDIREFKHTFQHPTTWKLHSAEPGVTRFAPASGDAVAITIRELGALTESLDQRFATYLRQIGARYSGFSPSKGPRYDGLRVRLLLDEQTNRRRPAVAIALNAFGRFLVLMLAADAPHVPISNHEPVLEQVRTSLEISPTATSASLGTSQSSSPAPRFDAGVSPPGAAGSLRSLPRASPGPLEGLYGSDYVFSRSGYVILAAEMGRYELLGDEAITPDALSLWQKMIASTTQLPQDAHQTGVNFGVYEIAGGRIRLRSRTESLFATAAARLRTRPDTVRL